jgi:cytochrome c553
MKKIVLATLLLGTTLVMADGKALFAKCAGCHGQNGEKAALGKSAIIKGQDAAKTVEQLNGYKAGTLNQHGMGALMKGQVASMSEADIKAVADYIAGLK